MTLRPHCPLCGGYLMPCTATATGEHPPLEEEKEQEGTSP